MRGGAFPLFFLKEVYILGRLKTDAWRVSMSNQTNTLGKRRQRSTNLAALVFLLPVFLILTVFIFYPIVDSFSISTYKWNGIAADKTFVGLSN